MIKEGKPYVEEIKLYFRKSNFSFHGNNCGDYGIHCYIAMDESMTLIIGKKSVAEYVDRMKVVIVFVEYEYVF